MMDYVVVCIVVLFIAMTIIDVFKDVK